MNLDVSVNEFVDSQTAVFEEFQQGVREYESLCNELNKLHLNIKFTML